MITTDSQRLFSLEAAPPLPDGMTTMMMPAELDLLYSIAKNYCTGCGAIVDAGVFLGASTACFAEGLNANPKVSESNRSVEIHTYERAIVTGPMLLTLRAKAPNLVESLGTKGESYATYLDGLLAGYPAVRMHVGDILEAEFPAQPVELLFLDILKSIKIQDRCYELFLPHLVPGRTLIVHQDYFWYLGWFVNAFMERYRDCFELVEAADTTAVFRLVRELPAAAFSPQNFTGPHCHETLALLDGARHQGETLAQHLMHNLCVITFVLQEMGAAYAETRLRAFELRFGDLMLAQGHRPDIRRATRAYFELRRRVETVMANRNMRKILIG